MKLNCIIDDRGYKEKPKGPEIGSISRRLEANQEVSLSAEEFKAELEKGKSYLSGHYIDRSKGRTKENIKNINFFSLDIDNEYMEGKEKILTNYTRLDAINKVNELLDIMPIMAYTTYSAKNVNGSERFRLIYPIDSFCGSGEISLLLEYVSSSCGDLFDKSCKDESRIFFATNQAVTIYDNYRSLTMDKIDQLKEMMEAKEEAKAEKPKPKKKKSYDSNYTDDVIDELKSIDISDYLIDQGYTGIEKYKDGYKMPCPIHGGKNSNFYINNINGAWLYKCFSKCNGEGGTIIDLHMKLNSLEVGQAINELSDIYNIKPIKQALREKDTYKIEKYISQDEKATGAILDAVELNRKTLITGSMGSGKTHFVTNDLYEYAKEIEKTLVVVIPGVKQLENLYINKGIETIHSGLNYVKGTDRVATTPESLPKVIKELDPDSYILVVDESHERYTSLYRSGYRSKNIEKAEKNAYRSIHLTATPRLLNNDNFDKVILIDTETAISNNISIFKVKNRLEDNMLSIIKTLISSNKKPILFNNNKEINSLFAKEIEVKEKITIAEYDKGQLDLFKSDDPRLKEIDNFIVDTETVESGKKSQNIESGKVKADLTCTTSAVMAGIDLYTDDNAVLVVNTRGLAIDNLIQLIGRFRKGIEVILIVEDPEEKRKYFNLDNSIKYNMEIRKDLERKANESGNIENLLNEGLRSGANLEMIDGSWKVNETEAIAEIYEDWSKAVFQNIDILKKLLNEQQAFKVTNIKIIDFEDEAETTISDLKKLSRAERTEKIEAITKEMLDLPDKELYNILKKDYEGLEDEQVEKYKEYFSIADHHMEKINKATDQLFTDDVGIKDKVSAFKHFYNNSWASIEREIAAKQARKVNRLIKQHGTEFYLSKEASKFKTTIDVVQAKIRDELKDLEKKQGRLSNVKMDQLTTILANEGYIYNKYTKLLKGDPEEKDKEKALKMLGDIVRAKVDNIYNFDSSGKLQSPKI